MPDEIMAALLHPPVALRREDDEDYLSRFPAVFSTLHSHPKPSILNFKP